MSEGGQENGAVPDEPAVVSTEERDLQETDEGQKPTDAKLPEARSASPPAKADPGLSPEAQPGQNGGPSKSRCAKLGLVPPRYWGMP